MQTLTDDVGIIQHARESVPDRSTGYCTDDVARAFIVMNARLQLDEGDGEALRLAGIYLAFLMDAQLADGRFHNFMSYARAWLDEVGTHDSCGRAIWSLGHAVRFAPRASWRRVCTGMLERSLSTIEWLEYSRAQAYAILGLAHAAAAGVAFAGDPLRVLARSLLQRYQRSSGPDWAWFEPAMTYDNARLPEALLRAGIALGDGELVQTGLAALDFLERVTFEDGVFVPIGNDGWYARGAERARFAQQPLEAAAMVDAEHAAFDAFKKKEHRDAAARAAAWFEGNNLLGAVMAHAGGCYDGLEREGPNLNMGAESSLAYLAVAHAQE